MNTTDIWTVKRAMQDLLNATAHHRDDAELMFSEAALMMPSEIVHRQEVFVNVELLKAAPHFCAGIEFSASETRLPLERVTVGVWRELQQDSLLKVDLINEVVAFAPIDHLSLSLSVPSHF